MSQDSTTVKNSACVSRSTYCTPESQTLTTEAPQAIVRISQQSFMKCGCQDPILGPQVSASEELYWAAVAAVCNNTSLLQRLTSRMLSTSGLQGPVP